MDLRRIWRGAYSVIPNSMRLQKDLRSLLLLALVPCTTLFAEVTLPKILSSHMVIQRDLPVHVWGMATPGEMVAVSFRGQTRSTKAGVSRVDSVSILATLAECVTLRLCLCFSLNNLIAIGNLFEISFYYFFGVLRLFSTVGHHPNSAARNPAVSVSASARVS